MGRLGRCSESLLSSEPIYTGGKGSAASLHCLNRHAPAGEDGGKRRGREEGAEADNDVKGAKRRLETNKKNQISANLIVPEAVCCSDWRVGLCADVRAEQLFRYISPHFSDRFWPSNRNSPGNKKHFLFKMIKHWLKMNLLLCSYDRELRKFPM